MGIQHNACLPLVASERVQLWEISRATALLAKRLRLGCQLAARQTFFAWRGLARRPALSGRDGRGKTSRGRAAACSSKMSELAALVRLRSSARIRYDVKDEDSAFFIIDNLRLWPFRYF
jgi:hypothetical protein